VGSTTLALVLDMGGPTVKKSANEEFLGMNTTGDDSVIPNAEHVHKKIF